MKKFIKNKNYLINSHPAKAAGPSERTLSKLKAAYVYSAIIPVKITRARQRIKIIRTILYCRSAAELLPALLNFAF